jgi:hypothetical protein
VVRFWNELDEEVEFALDVVDDLHAEAKEIRAAGNHWLTYSPCLHMVREGGTRLKLLDLLDERRFTPAEVRLTHTHTHTHTHAGTVFSHA